MVLLLWVDWGFVCCFSLHAGFGCVDYDRLYLLFCLCLKFADLLCGFVVLCLVIACLYACLLGIVFGVELVVVLVSFVCWLDFLEVVWRCLAGVRLFDCLVACVDFVELVAVVLLAFVI